MDTTRWKRHAPEVLSLENRLLDSLSGADDKVRPRHLAVPRETTTGTAMNHQVPRWGFDVGTYFLQELFLVLINNVSDGTLAEEGVGIEKHEGDGVGELSLELAIGRGQPFVFFGQLVH
jgi:hypothetical protein